MVLIPKTSNVDIMDQFEPIAMAKFKFKIISKIIADRLAQVMPNLISMEERGFIQGRNINYCVCLASEAINIMDQRSFGGNLAEKVNTSKAFNTLDLNFLLKVLKKFGFYEDFYDWIDVMLHSTTLSICINGTQQGLSFCARGVRQGDPLSPLLLCISVEAWQNLLNKTSWNRWMVLETLKFRLSYFIQMISWYFGKERGLV